MATIQRNRSGFIVDRDASVARRTLNPDCVSTNVSRFETLFYGWSYSTAYYGQAQDDESDWSDLEQHGLRADQIDTVRDYLLSSGQAAV